MKLGFTRQAQGNPDISVPILRHRDLSKELASASSDIMPRVAALTLHLVLFLLTFLTCTIFGFALFESFSANRGLDVNLIFEGYARLARGDSSIFSGTYFSVPLLTILLAHEFGHYYACKYWRVKATLPFFLPSPTLLGTLGAFIKIQSPIYNRNVLFDIGASGPIAGFIVLIPFLILGVHWSREVPHLALHSDVVFGTPILLRLVEIVRFPGIPSMNISLHPMAMAAWAGLVATATNLLPAGQLDGGHILYAVLNHRGHRISSSIFVALLLGMGFLYWPWWILALLLFLFGRRHPLVQDQTPVSGYRNFLSIVTLVIFGMSILLTPVEMHGR